LLPDAIKEERSANRSLIQYLYVKNLEWLYCKHGTKAGALADYFNAVVDKRQEIADTFYKDARQHKQGDATHTGSFLRDQFDVIISVWVLNYLNDDLKTKVLKNAFYWAKPKAQLRIHPGTDTAIGSEKGTLDATSFKQLFDKHVMTDGKAWYVNYEAKRIHVNTAESREGLLVLDVEPAPRTRGKGRRQLPIRSFPSLQQLRTPRARRGSLDPAEVNRCRS
jgi:hypothetical protein